MVSNTVLSTVGILRLIEATQPAFLSYLIQFSTILKYSQNIQIKYTKYNVLVFVLQTRAHKRFKVGLRASFVSRMTRNNVIDRT